MSGGHFDYHQYYIDEIADKIEDYIYGHDVDDEDIKYMEESSYYYIEEDTLKYIKEHKHTVPNEYEFSEETISELKKGVELLRMASVYAQRIDWLFSGDDSEESFHKCLKDELNKLGKVNNLNALQVEKPTSLDTEN